MRRDVWLQGATVKCVGMKGKRKLATLSNHQVVGIQQRSPRHPVQSGKHYRKYKLDAGQLDDGCSYAPDSAGDRFGKDGSDVRRGMVRVLPLLMGRGLGELTLVIQGGRR